MKIAAFLQDLAGGGAERVAVLLLNRLAQTHDVTLILARREGPYLADVDPAVRIVDLGNRRTFSSILPLARWLRRHRPDVLISHLTHVNIAASLAVRAARSGCMHVAVEHNQMDLNFARVSSASVRTAYRMVRFIYPGIGSIVCVSDGVAESVRRQSRLASDNIVTIGNPVVTQSLRTLARVQPEHDWLRDGGPPVILGCGRLVEQKDFATLIDAFAIVQRRRAVRLLILGEGELRPQLERRADDLGVAASCSLPGFAANPFAAMRTAAVFALSSRWEGLPTVLIEALASGAVVVATDCPSGPREVLQDGAIGPLVAVGDAAALASAIEHALDTPVSETLRRARAEDFTVEHATDQYERLFATLIAARR